MDAIYFDINPEMGLQAQQDFQTLVYEHLYTIISFLILFQQYANDHEFFPCVVPPQHTCMWCLVHLSGYMAVLHCR